MQKARRTFLGLLYVANALIEKGLLHKDPNNKNNILVYRTRGSVYPAGWYSENIHESMSETWHNKDELETFLSIASEHGVDIEECFRNAANLLGAEKEKTEKEENQNLGG